MPSPKVLLTASDIRPKKSLGQNFLCDPQAAEAIVRHGRIGPADTVVEIGAGTGALTIHAARAAARVYAVETDGRLMDLLADNLRENGLDNVTIVNRSVMDVDLSGFYEKAGGRLVVMGNLPYYLSSQILVRLIQYRRYIERAVLMFQQELADRITAPPGSRDYGRLSVMLRYCAEVKSLMRVRKELFYPRPKVASVVVGIVFRNTLETDCHDDELLFEIVKIAFAQRRKTIRNALASGKPEVPPAIWEQVLQRSGISGESRAETLDAPDYLAICRHYTELTGNDGKPATGRIFMSDNRQDDLEELINTWQETPTGTRRVFLRLKEHLEAKEPVRLAFKARPGVSFSLRAATPGQDRDLFVMVDIIDDDPQSRWLSVCFYGEMITDPEERGDLIPGGLLGEDGHCFDIEEDDDALVNYVLARIDEAHRSAIR